MHRHSVFYEVAETSRLFLPCSSRGHTPHVERNTGYLRTTIPCYFAVRRSNSPASCRSRNLPSARSARTASQRPRRPFHNSRTNAASSRTWQRQRRIDIRKWVIRPSCGRVIRWFALNQSRSRGRRRISTRVGLERPTYGLAARRMLGGDVPRATSVADADVHVERVLHQPAFVAVEGGEADHPVAQVIAQFAGDSAERFVTV